LSRSSGFAVLHQRDRPRPLGGNRGNRRSSPETGLVRRVAVLELNAHALLNLLRLTVVKLDQLSGIQAARGLFGAVLLPPNVFHAFLNGIRH